MAGLIKKQILKHLSKFTKNLAAESINLSTFRGEGELTNLELDCEALQNLVNLPTWLQLNKATCNKVSVKIPWTKLKTAPIRIYLDAVEVEMITCEKPRAPNGPSPIQSSASSGGSSSYGYTVKVLEGISLHINSISINFQSAAFNANFQLSQLSVESTDPLWNVRDLRATRILDKTIGQVLSFKQVSWQTMRIVADAVKTNDKANLTPIRLITNQTRLRLTLRRQTSDCSLVASRLSFQLDDLLWVLTDSQVRAALLCVKSLSDAIDRSEQQRRNFAGSDTEPTPPPKQVPVQATDAEAISNQRLFAQYSILESSFHVDLERVDLHVCEDGTMFNNIDCERIVEGGAIQMTLHKVKLDHYPEHKADGSRSHFRDFGDAMEVRNRWANDIIKKFRHDFSSLKKATSEANNLSYTPTNRKPAKLMESCFSVRVEDVDLYQVSASTSKKSVTSKLITSDRKELLLPEDMPLIHMIQTEYVYPDGRDYPAPHNNLFIQVNAVRVNIDWNTLLWLNQLSLVTVDAVQKMLEDLGVLKTLQQQEEEELEQQLTVIDTSSKEEHTDIRIQLLMPKIFIPGPKTTDLLRPVGMEVQVSMATITNCREGVDCSRGHLNLALENLRKTFAANFSSEFPNNSELDLEYINEVFQKHADSADLPIKIAIDSDNAKMINKALKSQSSKDIWSVSIEQLWMDFIMSNGETQTVEEKSGGFLKARSKNISNNPKRPSPFIDSFPIILWIAEVPHISFDVEHKDTEKCKTEEQIIKEDTEDVCPLTNSPTAQCSLDRARSPETCLTPTSSSGDSPKLLRNPKLMQYYSTCHDKKNGDVSSQASSCAQSTSSTRSRHKSKATYILAHTDSPIRLQLDHHQLMFILRLIDDVEQTGKRAQSDTESITRSIAQSPVHSSKGSIKGGTSGEASAFRLFTPNADLFLILREVPQKKNEKENIELVNHTEEHTDIKSETSLESPTTLPNNIEANSSNSPISNEEKTEVTKMKSLEIKFPSPPLSESGSDTISIFGDTASLVGDVNDIKSTFNSHPSTPQTQNIIYDSASLSLSDSKCRGDSLSSVRDIKFNAKQSDESQLVRNYSTGNLTTTRERRGHALVEQSAVEQLSINTASSDTSLERGKPASISSSSGYESITQEPTSTVLSSNQVQYKSNIHRLDVDNVSVSSHSSVDDFVLIQTETKTNSSQNSLSLNQVKFSSSSRSGSQQDANSIAGSESSAVSSNAMEREPSMLDSQLTVKNGSASSISSTGLEMTKLCQVGVNTDIIEVQPELNSLLHIHAFNGISIAVDSHESTDSTVKIVAPKVKISEVGNFENDKIQSIFTTHKCKSTPLHFKSLSTPNVSIRIESGPRAGKRFGESAVENGYLHLKAHNIEQSIKSSTLTNIGAFFEDEVEPKVMQMKINANNLSIEIQDDMPLIYETSISGPPISLNVHAATVDRDVNGTFHINLNDVRKEADSFPSNSIAKENATVPSSHDMLELQDKCNAMEVERESLAEMLKCLQDQLLSSEKEKSKLKTEVSELQSICELLQNQR